MDREEKNARKGKVKEWRLSEKKREGEKEKDRNVKRKLEKKIL